MFQKLYRLLEDIDENTKQQNIETGRTRIIMNELGKEMALRNQLDSRKYQAENSVPQHSPPRPVSKFPLFLSCLGIIALFVFSYCSFRFFSATQRVLEKSEAAVNMENYTYTRYNEIRLRQGNMAAEVSRLDSLIQQERLSLAELKKLNETAVRTFIRIRKDIERRKEQEIPKEK